MHRAHGKGPFGLVGAAGTVSLARFRAPCGSAGDVPGLSGSQAARHDETLANEPSVWLGGLFQLGVFPVRFDPVLSIVAALSFMSLATVPPASRDSAEALGDAEFRRRTFTPPVTFRFELGERPVSTRFRLGLDPRLDLARPNDWSMSLDFGRRGALKLRPLGASSVLPFIPPSYAVSLVSPTDSLRSPPSQVAGLVLSYEWRLRAPRRSEQAPVVGLFASPFASSGAVANGDGEARSRTNFGVFFGLLFRF